MLAANQYQYYLFDSPIKPWRTFHTFDECERVITTELTQPLIRFETEAEYRLFAITVSVSQSSLWVNGQLTPTFEGVIHPQSVIIMDTGKDWISLIQEADLTFTWQPQLDHAYRHLGERMLTIQDAIRKIDDMPIYIFDTEIQAKKFFAHSFPEPEFIPLPIHG